MTTPAPTPGTRPCPWCGVMLTADELAGERCPVCDLTFTIKGTDTAPDARYILATLRRIAAAIEAGAGPLDDEEPDEPPEPEPWRANPRRRRPS
jgi:uncharacterized Zn finger protein (UPF0148 family)